MPEDQNSQIPVPLSSGATDNPNAPQSGGQPQYTEGSVVQDAAGNQLRLHNNEWMPVFDSTKLVKNAQGQTLGLDPRTNQWVDVVTGKPYQAPEAAPAQGQPTQSDQTAQAKPSIGEQARQIYDDYSMGVLKGAGQTAHTVAQGLNKIPYIGETLSPSQGVSAMGEMVKPTNTAQAVGSGAEALLEMMLPDSLLKELSLAERLTLGAKIAKLAEDYPMVGKILTHGLNAVRMGTAGAVESMAKGVPAGQAIEQGAEGAALGTGVGAAMEGAGAIASHLFDPTTGKIVKLGQQLIKGEGMTQAPAQAAMRAAAGEVPASTGSVRELLTAPIERAMATAKAAYDDVEKVTGVDLKVIQQKLDNTIDQINELTGTEVDIAKEAQLEKARTELIDQVEEAKAAAAAKGLPADAIDKADAAYTKAKALAEVKTAVFNNEGVIKGNIAHGAAETINVDNAIRNLEKLNSKVKYGAPRLQQAFGEAGASKLMREMYDAQKEGIKAMSTRRWAAIIGGLYAGSKLVGATKTASKVAGAVADMAQ